MNHATIPQFSRTSRVSAFSLVEVVLAIGIVSFALLTVLNLFGGMMKSSVDNTQRREFAEAVDALRGSLNDVTFTGSFEDVLQWADQNKELVYVTYRASTTGAPDANGSVIVGKWMDPDAENLGSFEAARSGRWLRAKLGVSPSNPGGTDVSNYSRSLVFVQADLDSIPSPDQIGKTNFTSSTLKTTLAVRR